MRLTTLSILALCLLGLLSVPAQAQFKKPKWLQDAQNGAQEAADKIADKAKDLDPTTKLRKELEEERARALKNLRKLDPEVIFRELQDALQQKTTGELKKQGIIYNKETFTCDLRNTKIGKTINSWMEKFAQGNQRKGELREFTFNVKSQLLKMKLYCKHCQSWGKIIPGQSSTELYSITQTAEITYNFKTNAFNYDIDTGKLGPRLNAKALKKLKEGDLFAMAEAMAPAAAGELVGVERKNEYDEKVAHFKKKYGDANVFFASKDFVEWASPNTLAKYGAQAVLTGGVSTTKVMNDLREKVMKEMPGVIRWLQNKGAKNAESLAMELLSGKDPSSPFLKFEIVAVRYSAREKRISKEWRDLNHFGFMCVWTDGKSNSSTTTVSANGHSNSSNSTKPNSNNGSIANNNGNKPSSNGTKMNPTNSGSKVTRKITFELTNSTRRKVQFKFTGSQGTIRSLEPGQTGTFHVSVGADTPAVFITQSGGNALSFTLAQNGKYAFREDNGQIKNFIK